MTISNGTVLASYEITGSLGVGGMGEVYRAKDLKLKREVALKVLPESFAADADRLARFQREAEMLASLNHPNIAQIFGLEKADGITALVMELIEGPTLADRIQQGPLPPDEALNIAMQIATALEAAHGRGIIHRDLKPANVKLRPDGTVKVLDFGIAKAIEVEGTSSHKSSVMTTPAMTETGMIMGTAAYMSPEQARGKFVDQRTDIWAFGCVLYEMLTGQPAFGGEDVMMTLARVLDRDTDMNSIPGTISPAVRHTIKLCLRKDPKKRVADIRDVRLALAGEFEAMPGQTLGAVHISQSFWRKAVPLALGLALIVGVAVWFVAQPPVVQNEVNRFVHATPAGQTLRNTGRNVLAVSPDGRRFVYNTVQGLFLRELGELDARLVPGTEAALINPVFSPDGQSLAYWMSDGMNLMRIAISGGAPVVIAGATAPVPGASWARDGTILFGSTFGIYRVSANGGTPELILETDLSAHAPELLPDGQHVIYTYGPAPGQIVMQSLSSGERTVVVQAGHDAHYLESGHLTYIYEGNLLTVAFDHSTGTVSGSPVPLVQGISGASNSASTNHGFTDAGTLMYLRGQDAGAGSTLTWVNRAGQSEPLALPPREHSQVRLSPDGARLATSLDDDLWVADIGRGVFTRLTSTAELELTPLWTPDGQQLIFSMANRGLGLIAADGTGAIEELVSFEDTTLIATGDWTPDQTLVFIRDAGNGLRLARITPFAGAERPLSWEFALDRQHGAGGSNLSPDGKWLAYHAYDTGEYGVYIERYPELGNRQLVSDADGGWGGVWSPDGTELFYRRLGDGAMMVVPITTIPGLSIGTPKVLFENQGYLPLQTPSTNNSGGAPRSWDLGPDGRFLMLSAPDFDSATNEFVIVENWIEELQRLVPVE